MLRFGVPPRKSPQVGFVELNRNTPPDLGRRTGEFKPSKKNKNKTLRGQSTTLHAWFPVLGVGHFPPNNAPLVTSCLRTFVPVPQVTEHWPHADQPRTQSTKIDHYIQNLTCSVHSKAADGGGGGQVWWLCYALRSIFYRQKIFRAPLRAPRHLRMSE